MNKVINVGFVGNPNCGKTTLFNAITGANLKVANWPGVTVEKKEGTIEFKGTTLNLIDLPGIYSLSSYSIEEKVTRKCIHEDEIDVIVNVVDASSLERNLYLTLQLIELGKPVVLALNMIDVLEARRMEIDMHRLPEMLGGIPVVAVSARKKTGLEVLKHAICHHFEEDFNGKIFDYSPEIEEKIEKLEMIINSEVEDEAHSRWHAIKLLEHDEEEMKNASEAMKVIATPNLEKEIIYEKYEYIEEIIEETLLNKHEKIERTDKVDQILTHRIWGVPIFLGVMALVFLLTFTVGDLFKSVFEIGLDAFSGGVLNLFENLNVAPWLTSLVVDGIIAGVGGILTFLPNIFILFVALAILEDSGYMARVAYVMDGIMGKAGLSGKAFLPMVLGFGCTVPAVMATRTLEHEKDRRKVMLIVPFMSCSARLPIYVLFAHMFFANYAMVAAYSLYVLGLVVAVLLAFIMNKISKNKGQNNLLIELPEYKVPSLLSMWIYVWHKVKEYIIRAGTVIFVVSIILWFILNFGINGMTGNVGESFGATLGKWLVPVLAPAGLGMWQIGVALISGLSAKEVVVSSFAVLFGISNINSAAGMNSLGDMLGNSGFGMLNAYSLMVFCLLYTPCIATLATIKKETRSWKFTIFAVFFQLIVAWSVSTLIFQVGSLF